MINEKVLKKAQETGQLLDFAVKVVKCVSILSTLCGCYYLFNYCRTVGIPFPFQLSAWLVTLTLIGVVAFGMTAILSGGVMLPAWIADELLVLTKDYLLARDARTSCGRVRLARYAATGLLPMWFALAGEASYLLNTPGQQDSSWISACIFAGSLVWTIAMGVGVGLLRQRWAKFVVLTVVQVLLFVAAYSFLIVLVGQTVPIPNDWPVWMVMAGLLAAFTLLFSLITYPIE